MRVGMAPLCATPIRLHLQDHVATSTTHQDGHKLKAPQNVIKCLMGSFLSSYLFHLYMKKRLAWRRPTKFDLWPHRVEPGQMRRNKSKDPFVEYQREISSIQNFLSREQEFADGDVQMKAGRSICCFSSIVLGSLQTLMYLIFIKPYEVRTLL